MKLDSNRFSSGSFKTSWPDHWTNGGTGVTKLGCSFLADQIRESVKLFNNPAVYLTNNNSELHTTKASLSDFWEFHRKRTST